MNKYENPHSTVQKARQQQFSLNVWAGIIDGHLIGPVFLPRRLNGQNYTTFLRDDLPQIIRKSATSITTANVVYARRRSSTF